jgi:hypothetical protein
MPANPVDYVAVFDAYRTWMLERIDTYSNDYKESLEKIRDGNYTADALANDVAASWKRMFDDYATLTKTFLGQAPNG